MTDPLSPTTSESPRPRRRTKLLVLTSIMLVVLLLLAAYVFAPTWVARSMLAAELDAWGLDYDGLETLDVSLLTGRVSVGPLDLHTPGSTPARIERFELELEPRALLDNRATLRWVRVSGVQLTVTLRTDGSFEMNGIPLTGLGDTESASEHREGSIAGWQVEFEAIEILDTDVLVETPSGGRLDVEVDRFELGEFRSWLPEEAVPFELEASVNDVGLNATGVANPLATPPTIAIETTLAALDLERIERFTGPLTLKRRGGVYQLDGTHELTLLAPNHLKGHSKAMVTLTAADYLTEGGVELVSDRVQASFDTDFELRGQGGRSFSGHLEIVADNTQVTATDQARIRFGSTRLMLQDIESNRDEEGNQQIRLVSVLEAEQGELSGRVRLSVHMLINIVGMLQAIASGFEATASGTGLEQWTHGEVKLPLTDLTVDRLHTRIEQIDYRGGAGLVNLEIVGTTEAVGIEASSESQQLTIEDIELSTPAFGLRSEPNEVVLGASLSARANGVTIVREAGRASFEALAAGLDEGDIRATPRGITGRLAASATLTGLRGSVPEREDQLPANFHVESADGKVTEAHLTAQPGKGQWRIEGDAEARGLGVNVGQPSVAKGGMTRVVMSGIALDETLRLVADALELAQVDLAGTRSFLALARLPGGNAPGEAEKQPAPTPQPESAPPFRTNLVENIQRRLASLGHDPGAVDGRMGPNTTTAIEAFQSRAGLAVDGLVSPELVAALEAAQDGEEGAGAVTGPAGPPRTPTLSIAQLDAVDGLRIHFSDDVMEPDVDVQMVFKSLSVKNLDTGNPEQPMTLSARAEVNELSHVEIQGWVTPLREPPNLNLRVKVDTVELPPYSSYTEEGIGLRIDEGQLSAEALAKVDQGSLDGHVELDLRRLVAEPLSEEDAKRLADTIGVPVDTALGLLADADGRITLSIPVSGTLDEPDIDVSDAVNKAIGGVLKAIFPPTWVAELLSDGKDDVDFEPILFQAGSDQLDDAGRGYLDKLAALMTEHPDAVITACGRAVASDAEALRSDSIQTDRVASFAGALAVARTRAVRSYLIKDRGLGPTQLTECRATFDEDDEGSPRVEMAL